MKIKAIQLGIQDLVASVKTLVVLVSVLGAI